MELDRTLIDKDGTPSAEELKEYFQRNDYTAFKPTYNPSRASQAQLKLYMKASSKRSGCPYRNLWAVKAL